MIKRLDNKDYTIARQIIELQKAAYKVEAELIGFMELPPLLEKPEDIMQSVEVYYGFYIENTLAGIISFVIEKDVLDIYKVAVHPDYFRRGMGKQLIEYAMQTEGICRIIVSTGLLNTPAIKLYTSMGFKKLQECEVQKGVFIVSFEKQLHEQ